MAATHPSLAAVIRRQIEVRYPYAACDDCLATLVIATAEEVREAATALARTDGFARRRRVCYRCRRAVELTEQE